MSKSNLFDIKKYTALPGDVREELIEKVDNFALLFNRMAHFAEKDNVSAEFGEILSLIDEDEDENKNKNKDVDKSKEIKAHFKIKQQPKRKEEKLSSSSKKGKPEEEGRSSQEDANNDEDKKYLLLDLTQEWNISDVLTKQYNQFLSDYNTAAKALFSTHEEIKLTAQWRVAIGLGNESVYENGFTFHPTYGIPYLPGSSLKGMTRHWAVANNKDKDQIIQIFGNPNDEKEAFQQGRVIFFDAYPTSLKEGMLQPDIMNNHYPEYYEAKKPPADWLSPRPIFFLTMREVEFQFLLGIIPRGGIKKEDEDLLRTAKEWLQEALFESGVGAKTAVGYGRMRRPQHAASAAEANPSSATQLKPEFKSGSPGKKLKSGETFDAIVTAPGKPCKATVYGYGGKIYKNIVVHGSVQSLKINDVIRVTIQVDGKGEKITSASLQEIKRSKS
ncbi:MAG: type III-B CRISPR module RAMP protein Cmr6 [Saprospiraceae bacterium]|nr:type III-B CRISPR module RAMP protein Cmr6 [Saprospiraceae bacterium]MDW8485085.1 type III-B CRISPR module RAMP protein Cmr6 [Saprospiraceae bacterium]